MKLCLLILVLIGGLPLIGRGQDQRICKDQNVPRGYRVVGETLAPECGRKTAWLVRKIGAAPPLSASRPAQAELGAGAPNSEKMSIRKLPAASKTGVNVPYVITGTIETSSSYFGPYSEAAKTHHAFELRDGTGAAFVYALKEESNELQKTLLARKNKARGSFTMVLPSEIPIGGGIYGDLIGYQLQQSAAGDETTRRNASRTKN